MLNKAGHFTYLIFNKPYGVLCQFTDEAGRKTLRDYLPIPGIYSVGRLDLDAEGLLFLTNDGAVNHLISDPRSKQPKTYLVQVEDIRPDVPINERLAKLAQGVVIHKQRTRPAKVKLLDHEPPLWPRPVPIRYRKSIPTLWLEITLSEGRNHQVKKMTAAVGLPCLRLVRTGIGPLHLGKLKPGEYKIVPRPWLGRHD